MRGLLKAFTALFPVWALLFSGAATTIITQRNKRPIYERYKRLLGGGTKPTLAELSLARRSQPRCCGCRRTRGNTIPNEPVCSRRHAKARPWLDRESLREGSHASAKRIRLPRAACARDEHPCSSQLTILSRAQTRTTRDAMDSPSSRATGSAPAAIRVEPPAEDLNSIPPSPNGSRRSDRRIWGDWGNASRAPTLRKQVQAAFSAPPILGILTSRPQWARFGPLTLRRPAEARNLRNLETPHDRSLIRRLAVRAVHSRERRHSRKVLPRRRLDRPRLRLRSEPRRVLLCPRARDSDAADVHVRREDSRQARSVPNDDPGARRVRLPSGTRPSNSAPPGVSPGPAKAPSNALR